MKLFVFITFMLLSFSSLADGLNRPHAMWKVSQIIGTSKDEFVKVKPADPDLPPSDGKGSVIYKVLIKRFELSDFENLVIGKLIWFDLGKRDVQAVPLKKWVGIK